MEMPGSVVLEARIRLEKGDKEAIQAQMSELAAKRVEMLCYGGTERSASAGDYGDFTVEEWVVHFSKILFALR
jgi:hypothetical protein